MALTNRQRNEINYCEAQIKWREQELKILESEFKGKKWRSESGVLDEQGLWEATQKIGKHRDEIQKHSSRVIEIQAGAE